MATSTITNTITGPTGTAVASARVVARLMPTAGFRSGPATEVARAVETTTNASGVWSLVLEENASITPDNTYYEITEYIPESQGGTRVWNILVGASDQTVLASLITPIPAAQASAYLTQAAADARYQALGGLSSSTPNVIEPDDPAAAGVSTSASRADHEHGIVAAAPTNVNLDGTNSEGASTSFARATHGHAFVPPSCRVFHNAAQSITNNTDTVVAFNSERWDTSSLHDTVTNNSRITIPIAGVYVVTFTGEMDVDSDILHMRVRFRINGATFIAAVNYGSIIEANERPMLDLSTIYKFAANDYVEAVIFQKNTSANASNLRSAANYSPEFAAAWIGVG